MKTKAFVFLLALFVTSCTSMIPESIVSNELSANEKEALKECDILRNQIGSGLLSKDDQSRLFLCIEIDSIRRKIKGIAPGKETYVPMAAPVVAR